MVFQDEWNETWQPRTQRKEGDTDSVLFANLVARFTEERCQRESIPHRDCDDVIVSRDDALQVLLHFMQRLVPKSRHELRFALVWFRLVRLQEKRGEGKTVGVFEAV